MDSQLIQFEEIPSPVSENKDVICNYRFSRGYVPHRLDKITLCPIDYNSDLQKLNTWDFVTCTQTANQDFPFEGQVVFSCEKYGYLVLDHANAPGYHMRYLDRDGSCVTVSNTFSIQLEAVESATMGMSYVFLSNEFSSDNELEPEPTAHIQEPEIALLEEPTSKPEPELEPTSKSELEPTVQIHEAEIALPDEPTNEPEPELEPTSKREPELELNELSLNLSEPGPSLFPLNMRQNQTSKSDRVAEQTQFLSSTLQELREEKEDLVLRYEQRQLDCEMLQHNIVALELKLTRSEEQTQLLSEGVNMLSGILCPGVACGNVAEQIDHLVAAATKITEEYEPGVMEVLKTENQRLKEEYQSLDAVIKDYSNQLILTTEEQAKNSEKMTQLSQENTFLKSYESPPLTTKSPRRSSDTSHPDYPPKPRPKHLTCYGKAPTESIIMTEPARGKSAPSFATLDFLRNASIHPETVSCPICAVKFDGKKSNVERTKHVNECIKKSQKK